MKKKSLSKILASVLVMLVMVGMLPLQLLAAAVDFDISVSSSDYYNLISKKDWELAPGIHESEIVLNNDAGSHRQVAHVVEVDLHNPYTKVIPSYKGMIPTPGSYGVQVMSQQAKYAEENGYGNVVAAMNLSLSWYDSAYYQAHPELVGEPLGYMVLDGQMYANSQGQTSGAQTCVVINFDEKDGVVRPADMPKVEIRSTSSAITGWEEQVIPANFGFLVKDGKNQYAKDHAAANGASRSFVGIKADGTFVMVMNDGRQAPYSTGFTNYEMAEFMLSLGCVQAVNGDGGGSSAFLSQRPGEDLKINCSPSDGAERETTHGVLVISTAPATGEFVRASISSAYDYYTPGSTVEFSAIGSDLVGTPADIPAEATWQLADPSFGTVENGVFTSNGKQGAVTVQMINHGQVVGEDTVYVVMPDKIAFTQENMVIPFGKTVALAIDASYDSKIVCIKPADVIFTLSNAALGAINGFDFTAAPEGTPVAPGTLTAQIGSLSVTANISLGKGSDIIYDFEDQNLNGWSIYTNYGKYGPVGPNGKVTDDNGNFWYHGQNERGYISVVDRESGKVRNGDYALAVECDFTQIYETGYHALNLIFPTIDTTDALAVGFWIYIPYDARHVQLGIAGGGRDNGELSVLCEGWHYLTAVPRADNTFYFVNISIDDRACASTGSYYDYINEPNLNGKYTFYIDDITVDYSTAVEDRENPVFSAPSVLSYNGETSSALTGQVVTYNTPTFEVKVSDFAADNAVGLDASTAKAYIDGREVECTYANGKMTVLGVALANGVHTVKFEIADNAGNSSWTFGKVVISAGEKAPAVSVVPKDPTADRLLIGSLYWLDVVVANIETVKEIEMVFDLNNASDWELVGMEVLEGFSAHWAVQADDNIATVILTRTGEVSAQGEAVIASIPVRTWESHITEYEGYEDQTPATLVRRGIIWAQSIEIALEKGVVTFIDNTVDSFGMNDLLVDTELFFTNYTRKSVEGAQAWIDACKAAGVGFHEHTATAMADKAATCTSAGYAGRTFCQVCNSVVDWGTILPAEGHDYAILDGKLTCQNGGELFSGIYTDGKTYIDGVVVANGWTADGNSYYLDGVKLTGSHFLDGVMYTFDENGVYLPDYQYNGLYEINDTVMYFINNRYQTGYQWIDGTQYYNFDKNGYAYDGIVTINGTECLFDNGISVATDTVLLAGICGEDVYYVIHADGRMVVDGTGAMMDFTGLNHNPWWRQEYRFAVKEIFIGKDITYIGWRAFINTYATKVIFEEGSQLKEISMVAFAMMYYLESIVIPDGVTVIGVESFRDCRILKDMYIPESVTKIDDLAFLRTPNVTLHIPEGAPAIEIAERMNIPYEIYAPIIASGSCGEDAQWELWENGTLKIKGSGAMADYDVATSPWYQYASQITKIEIGKDITYIGRFAFMLCNKVTSVEFAENSALETIGWASFGHCSSLESITIPASVKLIDTCAFYYCASLKTVAFAENSQIAKIGGCAFRADTALTYVYLPDSLGTVVIDAFHEVPTTATLSVLSGSVACKYALTQCFAIEVRGVSAGILANGSCGENAQWELSKDGTLKITGNGAMADYDVATSPWYQYASQITKIEIGKDITYIGRFAFMLCNKVTSVEFAENSALETIGWASFGHCSSLESITIPASVKLIDTCAFYYCTSLKTVAFAENSQITKIGGCAFRADTALTYVYLPDSLETVIIDAFHEVPTTVTLSVLSGSAAHAYALSQGFAVEVR